MDKKEAERGVMWSQEAAEGPLTLVGDSVWSRRLFLQIACRSTRFLDSFHGRTHLLGRDRGRQRPRIFGAPIDRSATREVSLHLAARETNVAQEIFNCFYANRRYEDTVV